MNLRMQNKAKKRASKRSLYKVKVYPFERVHQQKINDILAASHMHLHYTDCLQYISRHIPKGCRVLVHKLPYQKDAGRYYHGTITYSCCLYFTVKTKNYCESFALNDVTAGNVRILYICRPKIVSITKLRRM